MSVHANPQLQMKTVSTTILTNTSLPTVQTASSNGLIHAVLAPSSTATDLTKQLQLRVVQTGQTSSLKAAPGQPQVVRLIKTPSKSSTSNANIVSVKAPIPSPIKGPQPTLVIPSNSKLLHSGTAKLKVGDTITIPKASLIPDKSSTSTTTIIPKAEILSTPPKLIRVADSAQAPIVINRAVPVNTIVPVQAHAVVPTPTSFSQSAASPARLTTISPAWPQSPLRYKRPAATFNDQPQGTEVKRRRTPTTDKGSKGLRHFAMLVCEKVKQKGTTTYNEVADELVSEYGDSHRLNMAEQPYDQKNIRRRVYDALNVLMAMNIIYKDKKDINWLGFPTNSAQELLTLQSEKRRREQRIEQKTLQLQELILQQIAFKNLVQRNKRVEETQGSPSESSFIQLPFIIVNTSKKTVIDCSISNDKYEYMFNFDHTFEIHDDIEVLKRMGMAYGLESGSCSSDNLRTAQSLLPPVLKPYLEEMASSSRSTNQLVSKYILQDKTKEAADLKNTARNDEALELASCFSMEQVLDPDDQEVAMVTDVGDMGERSNDIVSRAVHSRSSSSGVNSALYSLTPMSSAGSESSGSTPFDSLDG